MILDTNGFSAMADGDEMLAPVLSLAGELAIPVIVLGEYRYGIAIAQSDALREVVERYHGSLQSPERQCRNRVGVRKYPNRTQTDRKADPRE